MILVSDFQAVKNAHDEKNNPSAYEKYLRPISPAQQACGCDNQHKDEPAEAEQKDARK